MSKTPADISAAIRATLALTIPGLSCEIGTPGAQDHRRCLWGGQRGVHRPVPRRLAARHRHQERLGLEQFVGIFGFGRWLAGKRAQGTMRVTVNTASTQDQTFPAGTQFYTQPGIAGLNKTIYFSSKQAVVGGGQHRLRHPG